MHSSSANQRQRCLDLLFANTPLFLTREQFDLAHEDWEMDPVLREDGSIGAIFVSKGPEFHFQKFGSDIQATRAVLKKYPGEIIQRYGYALTKTPKTDARQLRFNARIGFYPVGEDEFDIYLKIEKMRGKQP